MNIGLKKRRLAFPSGGLLPSLLIPLVILTMFALPSGADVVLSEVLADPVSDWSGDGVIDYKNDEWIEICNRGEDDIDISAYWISDSVDNPVYRYQFSGLLSAGAVLHVTGAEALAWQAQYGMGSAGFSLSNSGGFVALYRDGADGSELMDSMEYRSYQIDDDRSMARFPVESSDWVLFDGLNIYHGNQDPGSTSCLPSPGETNVCEGVAAVASSWGEVKSNYPD